MIDPNSDKWSHGYMPAYFKIRDSLKDPKAICEVGVREGDSLKIWLEMFPGVKIVGVDYDPNATWPDGTVQVFGNQVDWDLPLKLAHHSPSYDLIVDDASHIAQFTLLTWQALWPLVSAGGFYVIEDWEIGFENNFHFKVFGPGSVSMAKQFLDYLDTPGRESIDSIEYRHGMIIFKKADNG
jgi:cephalosporin hydroxylase